MLNPLVILSLGGALHTMGHAIMVPLYWAVSGLLVLFHYLWSPLFGRDSGISWTLAIVCLTIFIRCCWCRCSLSRSTLRDRCSLSSRR